MRKSLVWISISLSVSVIQLQAAGLKNATVRFSVIDDDKIPVTNAHVFACSLSSHKGEGYTDSNGIFIYEARSVYSEMYCKVRKEGYYLSAGSVWVATKWGDVPANTLSVVLKRIINPVPMLKRKVAILFPVLDQPLGFDFEVGDLIEPYGKGKSADVWITGTRKLDIPDAIDHRAIIVTSNALNGFIEFPVVREMDEIKSKSDLEPPQRAPDVGYTNQIAPYLLSIPRKYWKSTHEENRDYLFRVRSQTNELGDITHANVGWFNESIQMSHNNDKRVTNVANRVRISFGYYYNPDPLSRSLEPNEIAGRQGVFLPKPDPRPQSDTVQPGKAFEKRVVTGRVADALSQQVRQFMLCMREGDTNKCATILADDFRTVGGVTREQQLKELSGQVAVMREKKVEWADTRVDAVYTTAKDNEFLVAVDVVMTRPGEKHVERQTWTFRKQNKQWVLVYIDI